MSNTMNLELGSFEQLEEQDLLKVDGDVVPVKLIILGIYGLMLIVICRSWEIRGGNNNENDE